MNGCRSLDLEYSRGNWRLAWEPKLNLAVIDVYGFNSTFFRVDPKLKPSWRNEMEITDAISLLMDSGFKTVPHHLEGWWKDIERLERMVEANHQVLDGAEALNKGKVENGTSVVGRVRIGKGAIKAKPSHRILENG